MVPGKTVVMYGFHPCFFILVKGYAKNGEVPVTELVESRNHIWISVPAGHAPAGPEINQYIFTTKRRKRYWITCCIVQAEFRRFCGGQFFLLFFQAPVIRKPCNRAVDDLGYLGLCKTG